MTFSSAGSSGSRWPSPSSSSKTTFGPIVAGGKKNPTFQSSIVSLYPTVTVGDVPVVGPVGVMELQFPEQFGSTGEKW